MGKSRVDLLLVERGLVPSRARAQSLIRAGKVVAGAEKRPVAKVSEQFDADIYLEITGADHRWVSRGGIKLAHALEKFGIDVSASRAIDIGASTGGFTDVLLHHGAAHVYAVDSGTAQLVDRLRHDARVTVMEQTNARYLDESLITPPVDLIVCDASFISLTKVLPAAMELARRDAYLIALIKPQFEVGRERLGKGGVVRDPALHDEVCQHIASWLCDSGWPVLGLIPSPIKGPDGNIEFLIAASRGQNC